MASNQNNVVGLAQSQASVADQQAIRSLSSTSLPSSDNSSLRSTSAASGPPHYVDLHVSAGECVSLQLLDGQEQVVAGPATITMISQQQAPPVPIPVQVSIRHARQWSLDRSRRMLAAYLKSQSLLSSSQDFPYTFLTQDSSSRSDNDLYPRTLHMIISRINSLTRKLSLSGFGQLNNRYHMVT